jgi:hypothetical protein
MGRADVAFLCTVTFKPLMRNAIDPFETFNTCRAATSNSDLIFDAPVSFVDLGGSLKA